MSSEEQQGGGATPPAKPHPNPIARLRELLSIPERVRTDAQWDEIIEIEITLGPRKSPTVPSGGHSGSKQHGQSHFRQNDQRGERQERKPQGGAEINRRSTCASVARAADKDNREGSNSNPNSPSSPSSPSSPVEPIPERAGNPVMPMRLEEETPARVQHQAVLRVPDQTSGSTLCLQ